ncbi:MAG: phospholipid carrier-dependent glycosyltransferase [Taibaiella sp.]|nr:phospholipid carrier-dependent glycosyltransferase [Taibaiella sp.]
MQSDSKHILYIGLGIGCISILYYLLLIPGLPVFIIAPVIIAALVFLYRWLNKDYHPAVQNNIWRMAILAIALVMIADKADGLVDKHGQWDAWAIWNLHAHYLADPVYWKNMFRNLEHAHPDYPLALPATIAFFSRLAGGFHMLMPYTLHVLIMLCIPVLIYTELYRKSLLVASLMLLLFINNDMFITQGVSQMADTMLAFFFLAAFVCFDYAKEHRQMIILTSAFLGLCMWTKNEGILLSLVFILFHAKVFVFEWKRVLYGIALPLIALLVFKLGYAPANDLVSRQSAETFNNITDWSRYEQIYRSWMDTINQHYKTLKYLVVLYLLYCLLRRKLPDSRLLLILTCLAGYFMIYIFSHQDLEWHLFTSAHRLLHQLMPVTVYVFAHKFAGASGKGAFQLIRL